MDGFSLKNIYWPTFKNRNFKHYPSTLRIMDEKETFSAKQMSPTIGKRHLIESLLVIVSHLK